jgi:hypothetical protein
VTVRRANTLPLAKAEDNVANCIPAELEGRIGIGLALAFK